MATRVICKNHGIVQVIPDATELFFVGELPMPWTFCPHCGERTKVERDERSASAVAYVASFTKEDRAAANRSEIDFYRKKYWSDEFPGLK